MTNPLTPVDLRVLPFTFEATTATVEALTAAGRAFLKEAAGSAFAPISVTLPKSRAPELAARAAARGLVVVP